MHTSLSLGLLPEVYLLRDGCRCHMQSMRVRQIGPVVIDEAGGGCTMLRFFHTSRLPRRGVPLPLVANPPRLRVSLSHQVAVTLKCLCNLCHCRMDSLFPAARAPACSSQTFLRQVGSWQESTFFSPLVSPSSPFQPIHFLQDVDNACRDKSVEAAPACIL